MRRLLVTVALLAAPALAHAQLEPFQAFPPDQMVFDGGSITSPLLAPAADNCTTPPYSFTGDATSGVCSSAAGTVNIRAAGTNRFSVGSTLADLPVDYPLRWNIGATGANANYPQVRWASSQNRWGVVTSATSPRTFFYLFGDATSGEPGQVYIATYDATSNFGLFSYDTDGTSSYAHQWYFRSRGADAFSVLNTGVRLPTGHVLQFIDSELTGWDGTDSISLAAATPSGNTTVTLPAITGTAAIKITSGALAFDPGSTNTGTCAAAITDTATGVVTTDVISWTFSADPTSTTGYNPAGDLGYIVAYPAADVVNFKFCNKSGSAIDPGAVTLNWRVDR